MTNDDLDAWGRILRLDRVPRNLQLRVLQRLIQKLDPAPKRPRNRRLENFEASNGLSRRKKSTGENSPVDTRDIAAARELLWEIRPHLAHQSPLVVGSTLASLISLWLAGIQPDRRDEFWRELIRLVDSSIDDCVAHNIKAGNLPAQWRRDH